MERSLKQRGIILGSGIVLYALVLVANYQIMIPDMVRFALYLLTYFVIGFESFQIIRDHLMERKIFDENLLMVLATIGAFAVGRYVEAVTVMLLFQISNLIQAFSVDRTKRKIAELIDIRPEYATRKVRGREFQIEPDKLKEGNTIVVKPGERVPVDAVIVNGITTLDTKALTGEAMPEAAWPGDTIYGGSINLTGAIEAKVTKLYKDSTASRIIELVEEAQKSQSDRENALVKFARRYSILAVIFAILVFVVPPLTFGNLDWDTWLYRALIVLIAACPAGLVMSIPIAFLAGIAAAARQGIIVKGGNYLEDLSKADTFVFDKTGTLTEGVFEVKQIEAIGIDKDRLLEIAAHVESYSNHPIAQSLMSAYGGKYDKRKVRHIRQIPGVGISATYEGERVHIGNHRILERQQVDAERIKAKGTVIYIIVQNKYAGYIVLADTIKKDAKKTLNTLREKYHAVLVMLTGDSTSAAKIVAKELDMDYAYTNLMPEDKMERIEDFLESTDDSEKVVAVGDGINDAPLLARAHVGIAMGALGSAAAVEAADVVLMDDELPRILDVIKIAKETMRVVQQNVTYAMVIKVIILLLATLGFVTMWEAVLAEMGVMVLSIINAAWVVRYGA